MPEWHAFSTAVKQSSRHSDELRLLHAAGIAVDLTAQTHSQAVVEAGEALLNARAFTPTRAALFAGECVNVTEERAAWHTMLRAAAPTAEVGNERARVREFVRNADQAGQWRTVVHIGIGGSDWGVRLASSACVDIKPTRKLKLVSNIDGHALDNALMGLDPHTTLIIVTSKSFTTTETLTNLARATQWLSDAGIERPLDQVVAVTARPAVAQKMGILPKHIFLFWDWVGGRFSLWSAVGLPVALALGMEALDGLLAGATDMDAHFLEADISENAPVQLALAGVANRSVLGFSSLSVAAYDARLHHLAPYLQQLDMESLGKSVDISGQLVGVPTGPSVWGMPGTDGQHTFFQWLHQGTDGAAVDFILCRESDHCWPDEHALLVANCLAQRETLLRGTNYETDLADLLSKGEPQEKAEWLAHHRNHVGGRPSNLIVLPRLTPYTLGALLAMYEHKIFVQALIWGINPFDQWGVEAGKKLATGIVAELHGSPVDTNHDASTGYWITQLANKATPTQ